MFLLPSQFGCSNISGLVLSMRRRRSGPDGFCAPLLTSLLERPPVGPSFNAGFTGAGLTCSTSLDHAVATPEICTSDSAFAEGLGGRTVIFVMRKHCPGDPRRLVRQRHGCDVGAAAPLNVDRPATATIGLASHHA